MKRIKYITIFACLSFLVSSCGNDFLNLAPISNANEENFYNTKDEINTALASAYNTLYTIYDPIKVVYFFGALGSDDSYTDDLGTGADYPSIERLNVRANNGEVYTAWNDFYTAMFKINKIIEKMENTTFEDSEAYRAELKFLRALYYFNMVQIWGGVPLITKPVSVDEAYAIGRATKEEVYSLIIEDLQYGIQYLPTSKKVRKVGAVSKGAAYALLGKVYLTNGDKDNAAKTLMNIYNNEYQLADKYADLWDQNKKNGKESIFEIQYLGGLGNPYSTYWALYTPANNLGQVSLQGGGHNQVSVDLWNAYESTDPRKAISIQDGWMTNDGTIDPTRFPLKWVDRGAPVSGKREAGNSNFIVLRYADVLLMLTEATGDAQYLNQVRARVGLGAYGAAQYPAQYNTVALAVEHERRIELALEFHRFFDLKRTGRAIEVMNNSSKQLNITEKNLLWPIPEKVIDQNPSFWKPQQNPGY